MCCVVVLQVIANTGGVLGMGGTPHEVLPRAGKTIVDVDKVPFKGPKTLQAKWHKVRSCMGFGRSGAQQQIVLQDGWFKLQLAA
jgi:hypothetical protein